MCGSHLTARVPMSAPCPLCAACFGSETERNCLYFETGNAQLSCDSTGNKHVLSAFLFIRNLSYFFFLVALERTNF